MTSSLRKDLNYYIYSLLSDEETIDLLRKEVNPSSLNKNDLIDTRSLLQLDQKDSQRLNGQRFAEAYKQSRKLSNPNKLLRYLDFYVPTMGFFLSWGAFLPTIQLLGDEQQVQFWRNQVLQGRSIGGYGQTQVSHGSDVKGLQTTATYDESKQAWIINSPFITSTKFWPGLLGQYCTHLVAQAKTFVKGKSLGNQTFVLEIRDGKLKDLPNVDAFDIGPKLGFDKIDNGGIIFKNLQVPRRAMLMKYVTVSKDGKVEGLQNTSAMKYSYGSMVNLRIKLTFNFGFSCIVLPTTYLYQVLKGLGVQNENIHKKYIIDKLCLGYGILLSNANVVGLYNQFQAQIAKKNYQKADKLLVTIHIVSATSKAVSSRLGVDTAQSLLTYNDITKFKTSNLPTTFANFVPSVTYQGDNLVLFQQTAKYLLFKMNLDKQFKGLRRQFRSNDWEAAAQALQYIIVQRLIAIKKRIQIHGENNVAFNTLWNEKEQISLIQVSQLWGYMTFLKNLVPILPTIKKHQPFYRKICEGFTNYLVQNIINDYYIEGFTIETVQTWKSFSNEEYDAMVEINAPVERQEDPMRYYQRNEGKWLQAKL